jgi:hypothetical protein
LSTANQAFPQFSLCFLAFFLVFSGFLQLLRHFPGSRCLATC